MSERKILIIGGYGTFGKLISKALSLYDCHIIIAGRNIDKAKSMANDLHSNIAKIDAYALDIFSNDLSKIIEKIDPKIVINASGPYQKQDYSLPEICISQSRHYIDLSDGREFVCGITKLNQSAIEKNVLIVSGASTVPGLSSAVIEHYLPEFSSLDKIDYGITPGNQTERGVATIASILSYVGKPISTIKNGKWQNVLGWQDLHRQNYPELGKRWMSNCDCADIELFPKKYGIKTLRFYAGLELGILHLGLWSLSGLARIGLIRNLEKYANILRKMSLWFYNFGSNNGGMHMILHGKDKNMQSLTKKWYIIAKNNDGPQIPCTASVLIAKSILNKSLKQRGAMPCIGLFSKQDFMNELDGYDIVEYEGGLPPEVKRV